jgi:hypothetical protein
MTDEYPLARPLRLKSKYRGMEGEPFTVDDQGTKKLFRDCTEEDKQFIVDSGSERFFAQEQPRSWKFQSARDG